MSKLRLKENPSYFQEYYDVEYIILKIKFKIFDWEKKVEFDFII
jgi:hypothetical protein